MRIEFENGSILIGLGDPNPEDTIRGEGFGIWNDIHVGASEAEIDEKQIFMARGNGKSERSLAEFVKRMEAEEKRMQSGNIKLFDKDGVEQASIPAQSDLLNAIVGYDHDPQTHNYNRAERRRIIKAAKELEKKYKRKGK